MSPHSFIVVTSLRLWLEIDVVDAFGNDQIIFAILRLDDLSHQVIFKAILSISTVLSGAEVQMRCHVRWGDFVRSWVSSELFQLIYVVLVEMIHLLIRGCLLISISAICQIAFAQILGSVLLAEAGLNSLFNHQILQKSVVFRVELDYFIHWRHLKLGL